MKILIALDSFKGSLTSEEAGLAVQATITNARPDLQTEVIPIADGGEGMLSVIQKTCDVSLETVWVHNPCMEIIPACYGISVDSQTAFIEMAHASGLPLIREYQRNPLHTTSFGTGELIRDALRKGCTRFILGIGGSATNDAGIGMLQALGYRFFDTKGKQLGQGGAILEEVVRIDDSERDETLKNAHFIVACDVQNPFYGPNGAAYVFAPQKGATPAIVEQLDRGMRSFAEVIQRQTGKDIASLPGSGAAGGLGGALVAFLQAELQSGADLLLQLSRFEEKLKDVQLIITGEGKIDRQSLMGKITGKILQSGLARNIPVIALAGCVEDRAELIAAGYQEIYKTKPDCMPLEEAMQPGIAKQNIQKAVWRIIDERISSDSLGSLDPTTSFPQNEHMR